MRVSRHLRWLACVSAVAALFGCEQQSGPPELAALRQAVSNGWTQVTTTTPPPERYAQMSAYSASEGLTIVFGGAAFGGPTYNDTWGWNGSVWVELCDGGASCPSPSARTLSVMVDDPVLGGVVIFGGSDNNAISPTYSQDTWVFDGGSWKSPFTTGSLPTARGSAAMAYDPDRKVAVLFGGAQATLFSTTNYGDTWELSGNGWVQRCSSCGPSARNGPMLSWDGHRVILFGGYDSTNRNDTWAWDFDAGVWSQLSPTTSPTARNAGGMAYDSRRGVVVLYGGGSNGSAPYADTWEWDGGDWAQTETTGPGARFALPMAFDSARGVAVIMGGSDGGLSGNPAYPDTWEYQQPEDTGLPLGSSCTGNAQCSSGFCVDGDCCQNACAGQCEACNFGGGLCQQVKGNPVPPREACNGAGTCAGTCASGNTDHCTYPGSQLNCSSSCSNGANQLEACDGDGGCDVSTVISCAPYVCGASACIASCTANDGCVPGDYCDAGDCLTQLGNGGTCSNAGECDSGYCVGQQCAPCPTCLPDGGPVDAGAPDAGVSSDGGGGIDAGVTDAGSVADAGPSDGGSAGDSGNPDGGQRDSGASDGPTPDAGSSQSFAVGCGAAASGGGPAALLALAFAAVLGSRVRSSGTRPGSSRRWPCSSGRAGTSATRR